MDYRSVERLEVFRDAERVGALIRRSKGCEFRYEGQFLSSSEPPIALHLPKTPEPLLTEGLLNLPTYFAGLLPEGVMFTAAQILIGSAKDDLFAVLAATGRDAVSDVEVRIPGETRAEPSLLNLDEAGEQIKALLGRTGGLVDSIAAIPGVQPKMSIGGIVRTSRNAQYIAKFPNERFPGIPENEAACMSLARKCGLRAPKAKVENGVYVVERFDRVQTAEGGLRKIHVEDMLQIMDRFPNDKYGFEFLEICEAMDQLPVSTAGILETMKLYAFSYLVGNGDLHAKNVSLIRTPDGRWLPSPAYDILSTLPYKKELPEAANMALALADESRRRFEPSEFVEFGNRFGIPEKASRKMVSAMAKSFLQNAPATLSDPLFADDLATMLSRAVSLVA